MRHPHPLPGSPTGCATVGRLRALGATDAHLRAGDLERPLHGVVQLPGTGLDPRSREARVAAIRALLGPGDFLSRRTAAREHGIPVAAHDPTLEIGTLDPQRRFRRPGVVSHRLRPGALLHRPDAPGWLPGPADTWCLLAQVASLSELVAAGDHLISGADRWAEPRSTRRELTEATRRFRGCAGGPMRRQALPLLRSGVESPAESELRLVIIGAGLPEPEVQCPIECRGRVFHADLGYAELKIAVEHQGAYHFEGGVEQMRRDVARHEAMRSAGWIVLLTTAHDLRDPRHFIARLVFAIAERSGR